MHFRQWKRREFITLLGGATTWPFAVSAQQASRLPTIGFFSAGSAAALNHWVAALVRRLSELGWIEGRTVAIEYRWAEGRNARLAEIAAEFVQRKVDVIVTHSAEPVMAAKKATSVIPIVFGVAADPLGTGLVASLARPGSNVTGLSVQTTDLAAKRLELLRQLAPGLQRLAVIGHKGGPGVVLEIGELQTAARSLGIDAAIYEVRRTEDFAPAFAAFKGRVDAIYVVSDPLMTSNRVRLNTLSLFERLPTMHGLREYVEVGGLISYGPNFPDMWRRAGDYVDRILRGAKPADLPVEQPTKFDLVINLVTANALGLTVPDTLLARADEVIE
jgi:putative ABC transport system substrate-binding protein